MRFFTILRNKDTLQNNFTFLNRMIITLMQMIGIHASMQNTSVNGYGVMAEICVINYG